MQLGSRSKPSLRESYGQPCPAVASTGTAAALLSSTIRTAPGDVMLITLGPVTNVAEALERDPTLATKIGRAFLIGGRLNWAGCPTTGFDTHDYNLWVDAPAAQAVLTALPARIFETGHEATDFVPLTTAFRERLAADRTTPAADSMFTMASHPLLVGAEADHQGGAYWWDPLDAVAATFGGIVSYQPERIDVIQSGQYEGRIVIDQDGTLVHYGTSARTDRFEHTFLDILNARYSRER
jgi:purine nucleosidase